MYTKYLQKHVDYNKKISMNKYLINPILISIHMKKCTLPVVIHYYTFVVYYLRSPVERLILDSWPFFFIVSISKTWIQTIGTVAVPSVGSKHKSRDKNLDGFILIKKKQCYALVGECFFKCLSYNRFDRYTYMDYGP